MLAAIMNFIYQHPLISGFILYYGSCRYLNTHANNNKEAQK